MSHQSDNPELAPLSEERSRPIEVPPEFVLALTKSGVRLSTFTDLPHTQARLFLMDAGATAVIRLEFKPTHHETILGIHGAANIELSREQVAWLHALMEQGPAALPPF